MGGVTKDVRKDVFGLDPLSFLDPKSSDPSPTPKASPAPSPAESAASAQGRFSAEERRRKRRSTAAASLGQPNLRFSGLGA